MVGDLEQVDGLHLSALRELSLGLVKPGELMWVLAKEARVGLMAQIAEEKVISFLLENAKIKEVKPKKTDQQADKKTKEGA